MKVLITGGAGFIGSTLTGRLLASDSCEVTVYDNFSAGKREFLPSESAKLHIIDADLLDAGTLSRALSGHDIVYHFASNPDISRGIDEPGLDYRQSIQVTFNLLEAMRHNAVRKLVFTSGSGIYGDTGGRPTAEDFGPLLPVSMYGAGKLGAEALISAFSNMFGMTSYILRMANVVGQHQTHGVILDFVRKLRQDPRRLQILGDGKQSKSYIHVDDILDACEFVMARATEPVNVFNISTADAVTVDEIAQVVVDAMNLTRPPRIEYTGGSRGWPGDVPIVRIDNSKLSSMGWKAGYSSREAVQLAARQIVELMNPGIALK